MTAKKMCNTINHNIEPLDSKFIEHIKKFETLLNSNNSINSNSTYQNDATHLKQISSIAITATTTTTHNVDEKMQSNAVWDRGKVKQDVKRLESSLETYLEALPPTTTDENHHMISSKSHGTSNILNAYLLNFENLSNDDLESFDGKSNSENTAVVLGNSSNEPNAQVNEDAVSTSSLSNFHNIQYIEYIHQKLEQYLKTFKDGPSTAQLVSKIDELKKELANYVEMINQRKESELKRFSENMSNHSNIVHMKNAFLKKEMHTTGSNVGNYDNISYSQTDAVSYYSNDSISDYERCKSMNFDGFFMKNCYDKYSFNSNNFDTNSVEYYSMLIAEDRNDNLVNDAPIPPPRYNEREKISLIYRNPDDQIIEQWQKYQLNTITIKPKKNRMVKIKMTKEKKRNNYDIWSFTLDYHKTRMLQMKLEKERKIRLICRMFFYFFGVACFILVVIIVQSIFNVRKK